MKIWKIKKEQVKEILKRKGYFFCHKYKYSHDKARTIMRKLCKEGLAEDVLVLSDRWILFVLRL